jgi:cytochrome c oxidase subunit 2
VASKPAPPSVAIRPAVNRIRPVLGRASLQSRRSRLLAGLALASLSLLAFAASASASAFAPQDGGSPNADAINSLYWYVMVVAIIVFVGVEGALFYSLIKFKARKGAVPAQIRGNTRLEIGWTVGAAVVLVILAVLTFAKLGEIRNPPNSDANGLKLAAGPSQRLPPNGKSLNICVNGQQYVWRYTYTPDCKNAPLNAAFTYQEMTVPVNTTVTLTINAQDVAHSWWIPKLGGKFDAIPGYTNYTWFKIPGKLAGQTFTGQCAELCGRNHANMTALVHAVSPAQYEQFIQNIKNDLKSADDAAAVARKQLQSQPGATP